MPKPDQYKTKKREFAACAAKRSIRKALDFGKIYPKTKGVG